MESSYNLHNHTLKKKKNKIFFSAFVLEIANSTHFPDPTGSIIASINKATSHVN